MSCRRGHREHTHRSENTRLLNSDRGPMRSRRNSSGTAAQGLSPRTLTQDSRRQGGEFCAHPTGRCERSGRRRASSILAETFGNGTTRPGVRPLSPIQIPPDSARLEGLAGLAPKGNRAQAFCASVDPLYLFSCGVSWHRERDASAVWELIQFLRSQDKGSRAIEDSLLARTEHARLLIRVLRRARVRVTKPAALSVRESRWGERRARWVK